MPLPPKSLPRFVPTLTDVVQGADVLPVSVPLAQPAASPLAVEPFIAKPAPSPQFGVSPPAVPVQTLDRNAAGNHGVRPIQSSPRPVPPLPQGMEEYMVHRVMQRVDGVLDQRLREAIALVIQEQTRSVLPRLREEIESVVRHAVYEAVADELAAGASSQPGG
ncbi:MAG: hypothetical protein NDI95_10995 [Acidovorax soli]|nr:hypothetical protein [Acidovorax soli]MCM2347147.1 hypothetical protein [Acidovorax soli]